MRSTVPQSSRQFYVDDDDDGTLDGSVLRQIVTAGSAEFATKAEPTGYDYGFRKSVNPTATTTYATTSRHTIGTGILRIWLDNVEPADRVLMEIAARRSQNHHDAAGDYDRIKREHDIVANDDTLGVDGATTAERRESAISLHTYDNHGRPVKDPIIVSSFCEPPGAYATSPGCVFRMSPSFLTNSSELEETDIDHQDTEHGIVGTCLKPQEGSEKLGQDAECGIVGTCSKPSKKSNKAHEAHKDMEHGIVDAPVATMPEEKNHRNHARMLAGRGLVVVVFVVLVLVLAAVLGRGTTNDDVPMEEASDHKEHEDVPMEEAFNHKEHLFVALLSSLSNQTIQALQDPESPQSAAFTWVSEDPAWDTYEDWKQRQRFAMAALYFSLGGPFWKSEFLGRYKGWTSYEVDECDWQHDAINHCHQNGQIKDVSLTDLHRLEGTIPSEISLLSQLEVLDFSKSQVRGSLHEFLPLTTNAFPALKELRLPGTGVSSTIATEVGRLSSLECLLLSDNDLSGTIPEELGYLSLLRTVNVEGNNKLNDSIPVGFCQLEKENELSLFAGFCISHNPCCCRNHEACPDK
jgi:hypothetical protein